MPQIPPLSSIFIFSPNILLEEKPGQGREDPFGPSSAQRFQSLWQPFGIIVTIAIVRYPEEAFEASVYDCAYGLTVLPALFPFFALAEILM